MHKPNTSRMIHRRNSTIWRWAYGELHWNLEIQPTIIKHKLNHGSNAAQKREIWKLLDLNLWKSLLITKSRSNATPSKGYMIDM